MDKRTRGAHSEELYVLNLEDRVMELEKLLFEVHRESELNSKVIEKSPAVNIASQMNMCTI